ncbi:Condensin complex subunit 1 [Nesidiocoris tenuis]|uniref:Condensin complex subunit 1 n=1 Tax=Nesidiocoris tenuis TaxID=355587 RepID=A0ABN7AYL2_9HEMI|nr:Condensin complex subunit 1 [Nesidiocoris tenuis]
MDEDWEFTIPLQREDLKKIDTGQYYVKEVFDLEDSIRKCKGLRSIVTTDGCSTILDHFDTLYSVFCAPELSLIQLQELYDMSICRYILGLKDYVREALQNDAGSRKRVVDIIKMILYIFSMFVKAYEDKLSQSIVNYIPEVKVPKKKGKKAKAKETWDWTEFKLEAFRILGAILSMNINPLWPNLVADGRFVSMIADCCYKLCENPDLTQAKNKPLKDTICHVLAVLVGQYNHGMTFVSRAVDLVRKNENTISLVSHAVVMMVRDYNCSSVLPRILHEFNDILQVENIDGLSKSVGTFITDIAETQPALLLPCVNVLRKNLVVEPYAVRSATLIAFCEIILKCLNGDLNKDDSILRRKLLKHLIIHLHDQNAYVRSKDLQLWTKLAGERVIPKDLVSEVAEKALARLGDKSAFVVKSTVQFFCVQLKNNPFAGKLNVSQLEQELFEAKAALSVISAKRTLSREETWKKLEQELLLAITKEIATGDQDFGTECPSTQNVSVQDVMVIITKLIQQKHFAEAYSCLRRSQIQWPEGNELRCNLDESNQADYHFAVLKKIFMSATENDDNELQLEFDCFSEEFERQMKIVEFAEEATSFAKLMCLVCDEVAKVMKSNSLLEVLEAIEFFSTAYQFGLATARPVIREALVYVKCKQPGVKEAVAAAYKTLYLNTVKPTPRERAQQIARRLIKLVRDLNLEQKCALEELMQEWMKNNELDSEFVQVLWEKYSKKQPETTEEESITALILIDMIAGVNPAIISSNVATLLEIGLSEKSSVRIAAETCTTLTRLSSVKQNNKFVRYPPTHHMFELASKKVLQYLAKRNQSDYSLLMFAAIRMIFKLTCFPEKIADKLLFDCYQRLLSLAQGNSIAGEETLDGSKQNSQESYQEFVLSRVFHIYSEILFRKWLYYDRDVTNCLKKPVTETVRTNDNEDSDEFELANREVEDDAIVTTIAELCEKLVLGGSKVETHIREMIVQVCKAHLDTASISLQSAAASSLSKMMMVSQEFCENNVQLYFTLLEKAKAEVVRSNLTFGLGDLIARFPNIIEPWTSHIYAKLKDSSALVRKNTVVVLCHLISREMVKVRGQIAEICLCLEDEEPSIVGIVQSLLYDLSQKGNTLYNIIADIISRLSNPDRPDPVSSEAFKRIMKFILGLVSKDRQNELLVEKLTLRLKEAPTDRQCQDLAFCLSLLSYNEKSLRRLGESLPINSERLSVPDVYAAITSIISTASKSINKPQIKEAAQDCQSKLDEILGIKDPAADSSITLQRSKRTLPSDDEDDAKTDDVFVTPRRPPPTPGRPPSTRSRARVRYDCDK